MKRAARAQRRITSARTFEDAEDAWTDFLTHANKVYAKLRAACHGQPLDWMWWKKKMDERRDDELLSYVHHARNSDTHRLEVTTEQFDTLDYAILWPLPVIDKGILYPVPTAHSGEQNPAVDVGYLSYLAGEYLQELVAEAALRVR